MKVFDLTLTVKNNFSDKRATSIIKDLLNSLLSQQGSCGQQTFWDFKAAGPRQIQGRILGAQETVGFVLSASRSKHWGIELTLSTSNTTHGAVKPKLKANLKDGKKKSHVPITVTLLDHDGVEIEALEMPALGIIEATLQLLCSLETRRSEEGQEAGLLINSGISQSEAARLLGVSQQAVSARLSAGHWYESRKVAYWVAKQLDEISRAEGIRS